MLHRMYLVVDFCTKYDIQKREHDNEEIMYTVNVSNKNIWDLSSSDSYYDISDASAGECDSSTNHSVTTHDWH
jgi:hypothetical protein